MMRKFVLTAFAFIAGFAASAQDGTVTYALPRTSIKLEVEAVKESFFAGPYSKYAQKYLGIDARQEDATSYTLQSVRMVPSIEAEPSQRFTALLSKEGSVGTFLSLTAQGLVSVPDGGFGDETRWRFPSHTKADFSDKAYSSNLTSEGATLYRNVKDEAAYSKVSVQQNVVVEKSVEAKAKETADLIFSLRKTRVQIVTGDTDASYSGEAMAAALSEINRLENEYLSLFTGYSDFQAQVINFDVIPQKGTNMYVAFRLSDSDGLVPAESVSGKPYVLSVVPQDGNMQNDMSSKAKQSIRYRIPAICTVKLMDGATALFQTRVPVYQMGIEAVYPIY